MTDQDSEAETPDEGALEDLKVEHEAMRRVLLQTLVKVGVIDVASLQAPWDAPTLLHFASLWLTDALPWVEQGARQKALEAGLNKLEQRVGRLQGMLVERTELLKSMQEERARILEMNLDAAKSTLSSRIDEAERNLGREVRKSSRKAKVVRPEGGEQA